MKKGRSGGYTSQPTLQDSRVQRGEGGAAGPHLGCLLISVSGLQEMVQLSKLPFKALHALASVYLLAILPTSPHCYLSVQFLPAECPPAFPGHLIPQEPLSTRGLPDSH